MVIYKGVVTTNDDIRLKVIKRLGGKCQFNGCEWSHPDVLEIDHIDPIGGRYVRAGTWRFHLGILDMEKPENEFQLLCANHHRLKTVTDWELIRERRLERE